jgi:hypothetical protein
MMVHRLVHAAAVHGNNTIYVLGGLDEVNIMLLSVEVYNIAAGE